MHTMLNQTSAREICVCWNNQDDLQLLCCCLVFEVCLFSDASGADFYTNSMASGETNVKFLVKTRSKPEILFKLRAYNQLAGKRGHIFFPYLMKLYYFKY